MLSKAQVRNAKPREKTFIIRDDRGLNLRVDPSGRKYWIFRYWESKKEHQISLGPYPDLSLKDTRLQLDELQTARAKGVSISTRSEKVPQRFSEVTTEWLKRKTRGRVQNRPSMDDTAKNGRELQERPAGVRGNLGTQA